MAGVTIIAKGLDHDGSHDRDISDCFLVQFGSGRSRIRVRALSDGRIEIDVDGAMDIRPHADNSVSVGIRRD